LQGFSLDAAEDVGCRPETNYGWLKGALGGVEAAKKSNIRREIVLRPPIF